VALILFIKSGYYNLIIDNVASWFGFLNIVLCIIGLLIATVKLIPLLLDLIQVLGESYQEVNGTCVGY
jgi:hypothetical protein